MCGRGRMHSSTKHVHSKCNVRTSPARSPQEATSTLSIFGAVNREVQRVAQNLSELQAGYYRRVDGMGVGEPMLDQERTKHWDSKIFALRDMITDFTIRFGYVSTKNQMADHLTKALPKPALERARGHCLGSRRIMFPVEFSKFTLEPPPSKSSPLFKAPVPGGGDRRIQSPHAGWP